MHRYGSLSNILTDLPWISLLFDIITGAGSWCVDGVGGDTVALVGRHHRPHLGELVADDGVVGSRRRAAVDLALNSPMTSASASDASTVTGLRTLTYISERSSRMIACRMSGSLSSRIRRAKLAISSMYVLIGSSGPCRRCQKSVSNSSRRPVLSTKRFRNW